MFPSASSFLETVTGQVADRGSRKEARRGEDAPRGRKRLHSNARPSPGMLTRMASEQFCEDPRLPVTVRASSREACCFQTPPPVLFDPGAFTQESTVLGEPFPTASWSGCRPL